MTLRDTATGAVSQMICDRNGNFRFAELAPGTYSVRVRAPGLKGAPQYAPPVP